MRKQSKRTAGNGRFDYKILRIYELVSIYFFILHVYTIYLMRINIISEKSYEQKKMSLAQVPVLFVFQGK